LWVRVRGWTPWCMPWGCGWCWVACATGAHRIQDAVLADLRREAVPYVYLEVRQEVGQAPAGCWCQPGTIMRFMQWHMDQICAKPMLLPCRQHASYELGTRQVLEAGAVTLPHPRSEVPSASPPQHGLYNDLKDVQFMSSIPTLRLQARVGSILKVSSGATRRGSSRLPECVNFFAAASQRLEP
jgi:hypothetical protein